jgi:anaerobic magnesium-protoporphyrin IX monomethyl ester cyclase
VDDNGRDIVYQGGGGGSSPGRAGHLRVTVLTLYLSESLGARQICSVLRARGHDCSLVFFKEFQWGEFRRVTVREEEMLLALLRHLRPDLVGLSLTSSLVADLAFGLADKIRARLGVPVVLGGAHPSVCPEESLQHAEYVCRGEGERAVARLADALAAGEPTDHIPNIWTKVDGETRCNEIEALADDLDSLPFVSFGEADSYLVENDRIEQVDPATRILIYHTAASRMACPFACAFCAGVWFRRELYANKGPVRRYRSVGNIIAEIKRARARHPGMQIVQFWDEVFAVRPPSGWLEEFCERFPQEIGLPIGIWAHPSLVTDDYVTKLRAAGLSTVVMGVESGSEKVRRDVLNRRERNSVVLRAASTLHRHGVAATYDFILDIPWHSEENCRGSFEVVMQLPRPFKVGLHSLGFLPHTAVTTRALAEGIIRPEQIASADRSLSERFESFLWKYRLEAGDRKSAFWHSLIYLAALPFTPRALLWGIYRLRRLVQLYPWPLVLAAEAARTKQETGQLKLWPAVEMLYPRLASFLARHATLGRLLNRSVRLIGRVTLRLLRLARA